MWIGIISLFPEMFKSITEYGIIGRSIKKKIISIEFWNPRDFTYDRHKTIDSPPYGGGPGMLMLAKPIQNAIYEAKNKIKEAKVIYLSPQGRKLNQKYVKNLSKFKQLILVCGRYKGIDERLIIKEIDEELSIGDYIISGGELAAMILIDSISRYIPGVLGNFQSTYNESFSEGLLDCPYYTRPNILYGMKVPSVLLSGNHSKINRWRIKESLGRTWLKRPELLQDLILTDEQLLLLAEFKKENKNKV